MGTAKGIILYCTSPIIKYSALCVSLEGYRVASLVSGGNSLIVSATVIVGKTIVECALG